MSEETGQEKSEQPTAKRLKETRDKGQVPRSKELNTMMLLMGSAAGFIFMGDSVLGGIRDLFKRSLTIENAQQISAEGMIRIFGDTMLESLIIIAPLFLFCHRVTDTTGYRWLVFQHESRQF